MRKVTRNGQKPRYKIEGTKNLSTDEAGLKRLKDIHEKYSEVPFQNEIELRRTVRIAIKHCIDALREEGRLWRRDGSLVT